MERSQVLDAMGQLKLYGMKAAYDGIMATAVKRKHEPPKIVGDLLTAEISEKQARSIKYQMTIARLPLAKEIDEFDFEDTPVNETLVRELAGGDFLEQQRNVVLIGGTGTIRIQVRTLHRAGPGTIPISGERRFRRSPPRWHAQRMPSSSAAATTAPSSRRRCPAEGPLSDEAVGTHRDP